MRDNFIFIDASNERFLGEEVASIYASAYCREFEYLELDCLSVHFDEWWSADDIKSLLKTGKK
jgi:hypothetical protein